MTAPARIAPGAASSQGDNGSGMRGRGCIGDGGSRQTRADPQASRAASISAISRVQVSGGWAPLIA
jgi:hypothetical protein